jgi:hypothetical protein
MVLIEVMFTILAAMAVLVVAVDLVVHQALEMVLAELVLLGKALLEVYLIMIMVLTEKLAVAVVVLVQ